LNGNKLIVGRTQNNYVGSNYRTINYGDSIPNPVFITQMQTCNDDTVTAVLRCLAVTEKYSNIVKQRERSTGNLVQAAETAGWMVISEMKDENTGVNKISLPELRIYPNPVSTKLYIDGMNSFDSPDVEIFNMTGVLVKRLKLTANEIDVSALPSGYYFLKIKNRVPTRFIKL